MPPAARPTPPSATSARRPARLLLAVLTALLCCLGPVLPAGAATAPSRITWAVQPAVAEGQQQRVSFRYDLEAGGAVTDSVTVTNFSDSPVEFILYASDGVITADGQFDLLPSATAPTDAGSWISIDQPRLTVPAQSSASVPFTLTVPANATPGDHPAGIVASLTQAGADGQSQVSVENRVGARVHLRVAGELDPVLTLTQASAEYEGSWNPIRPGSVHLTYTVENTGNVRLGSEQTTRVGGLFGIPLTTADGSGIPELLPGSQFTVTDTVDGVWPLFRLRVASEGEAFAVGNDAVDVPMTVQTGTAGTWAMPWSQLLTIALLALVVYGLLVRRRRARARLTAALEKARAEGAAAATGSRATEDLTR